MNILSQWDCSLHQWLSWVCGFCWLFFYWIEDKGWEGAVQITGHHSALYCVLCRGQDKPLIAWGSYTELFLSLQTHTADTSTLADCLLPRQLSHSGNQHGAPPGGGAEVVTLWKQRDDGTCLRNRVYKIPHHICVQYWGKWTTATYIKQKLRLQQFSKFGKQKTYIYGYKLFKITRIIS